MSHEKMNKFVFSLRGVEKDYPENPITFEKLDIPSGQIVGILGTSGCGKTTLLNLLALIDKCDGGEITFYPADGKAKVQYKDIQTKVNRKAEIRSRHFGYIFQSDELLDQFPVGHNIQLPCWLQDSQLTPAFLQQQLKLVGLDSDHANHWAARNPADLSEGQRSRIALLRALASCPEVIFADEPTANLDEKIEKEIMELLVHWMQEVGSQRTVLLSTHNLRLAAEYCSHFIIIKQTEEDTINENKSNSAAVTISSIKREISEFHKDDGYDTEKTYQELKKRIFGTTEKDEFHSAPVPILTINREITQTYIEGDCEPEVTNRKPEKPVIKMGKCSPDVNGLMNPGTEETSNHSKMKLFWKLLRYDFWRHPRNEKNFLVTHLSPVLFIVAIIVLVWGGSYILGVRAGSNKDYQKAMQNDLLWTTEVTATSPQIEDLKHFYSNTFWRSVNGFSRKPISAFLYGEQSESSTRGLVRILGRTMEKDDPLLDVIEKSLVWPQDDDSKIQAIDRFRKAKFGIIVAEDLLTGALQYPTGRWPKAIAVRQDSLTIFWFPILGVAKEIPGGDFIVSKPVNDALMTLPFDKTYLHPTWFTMYPKYGISDTQATLDSIKAWLTEAGFSVKSLIPKTVEGRFTIKVGLDKSERQFNLWRKIESNWGKYSRYIDDFEFPMTFPPVTSSKEYIHWSVILHQNAAILDSFITVCYDRDLSIDTSVRARIKSLEQSHNIFNLMSRILLYTTIVLGLFLLGTNTWFDSDKKIHSVGVMLGVGVSRTFLILAFTTQLLLLIGAGLLAYIVLDLGGVLNQIPLKYTGFSLWWWIYSAGLLLFIPALMMALRYYLYRKEPALLIRHRF